MKPTLEDIFTLARTIFGESRGEQFEGRVAVAWVILNRVRKGGWWGDTIKGVCRKPYQFSCWNENDPNRKKLDAVTVDDPVFLECLGIAALVTAAANGRSKNLSAEWKDPTSGATHYHTNAISPKWAEGKEPVCRIGNHAFYTDIG